MMPIVEAALKAITNRTNLNTGFTHSNDMNAAKEMFARLHRAEIRLMAQEIGPWALMNGWHKQDANKLGELAQEIGNGKKVRISGGPWWKDDILETLQGKT